MLMLILLATGAVAQNTKLLNVESCNGGSKMSAESQITGCTALIDSGLENSQTLVVAYNNRGNAHTRRGEYDLAIKDYDECIKLYPDYARAFNNRGEAYAKKGEYSRAIEDFDAAISFDPKYGSAFANRAQIYENAGKFDRALKDLDEAVRFLPAVGSLWNKRCWARFVVGNLQSAVADCNEAIRLEPIQPPLSICADLPILNSGKQTWRVPISVQRCSWIQSWQARFMDAGSPICTLAS